MIRRCLGDRMCWVTARSTLFVSFRIGQRAFAQPTLLALVAGSNPLWVKSPPRELPRKSVVFSEVFPILLCHTTW